MNWVILATYTLPQDMHLHRSILELEGIECSVKDELTTQVHNFYSNAIGGAKLMVKPEDYEKAVSILSNQVNFNPYYDDEQLSCVYCNSNEVKGVGISGKFSVLLLHLTGYHISVGKSEMVCQQCKRSFPIKTLRQKIQYEKGE